MTTRSYFGMMNSTLGSVVPLAMFYILGPMQTGSSSQDIVQAGTSWGVLNVSLHVTDGGFQLTFKMFR